LPHCLADEFTAQRSDAVVHEVEELEGVGGIDEFADEAHAFIANAALPDPRLFEVLLFQL
jgi:hypothetical protein